MGSTATTPPDAPHEHLTGTPGAPQPTQGQHLPWAPRVAPPLPDQITPQSHYQLQFFQRAMNTPPDVEGAEGSQICSERPARAGMGPLSSHCPAVGQQDCPDTRNLGSDFPWSLLKINPVTNSSCCQHQDPSCWEKPWLCHRTRASVHSLPVPWATDWPPIQALWVPLQQRSRVGPLIAPELSHTGGPRSPPVSRPLCRDSEKLSHFALSAWSLVIFGEYSHLSEARKHRAGTEIPCAIPASAKTVVLQPLPAAKPNWEHYPSPTGKIPVARTTNP